MVTKKTRLLSAIAAVLMLVSMFAGFVIPASAEAPSSYAAIEGSFPVDWPDVELVPYAERYTTEKNVTDGNGVKHYAITNANDWIAMASDCENKSNSLSSAANVVLWLTNDIDFSDVELKQDVKRLNFVVSHYKGGAQWSFGSTINGQGFAFKNLVANMEFDVKDSGRSYLGLIGYGLNATIRDLTVDASCSFTFSVHDGGYNDLRTGVFMGYGTACTFINCRNEASLTYTRASGSCQTSVAPFGRQDGTGKLINCVNTGNMTTNDVARACGMVDWLYNEGVVFYNCFSSGKLKSGSTSANNTGFLALHTKNDLSNTIIKNCYMVGASFACGDVNRDLLNAAGVSLEAGAEATGELAFLLNKNRDATYDNLSGATYYTVKDGKTVFGTAANKTVKLEVIDKETETGSKAYYVNLGGTVDISDAFDFDNPVFTAGEGVTVEDGKATVTAVSADLTAQVEVTNDATTVNFADLEEKLAFFAARNPEYYTKDGETLTATLETIKAAYTTYTQEEVNEAIALLDSFVLTGIPSINDWALYTTKVPGYTVASIADMELVAAHKTDFAAGQKILITEDLDFTGYVASEVGDAANLAGLTADLEGAKADGEKATITGLTITGPWLGAKYDGSAIKNLVFDTVTYTASNNYEGFLFRTNTKAIKLSNITMQNCVVESNGKRAGLMTGFFGKEATIQDVTVVGCTINGISLQNVGFLATQCDNTNMTIKNVYLNNNTMNFLCGDDFYNFGALVGQIAGRANNIISVNVENVGIFNTQVNGRTKDVTLVGQAQYAKVTVENFMAAGNDISDLAYDKGDGTVGTMELTATKNVYYADDAIVTSGEAAYELNKTVDKKWAMDGETPIFDTEETAVPVQVTFTMNIEGEDAKTYNKFTDKDGVLIVDNAFKDLAEWNIADWATVYTADAEVTGTHAHNYEEKVTDPTCTTEGYTTYTCACEASYVDDEVAALGHSYNEEITVAPGCETAGTKTYTCDVCGDSYTEPVDATGHIAGEPVSENVVPATCTEAGSYEEVVCCTVEGCGAEISRETKEIAPLGHELTEVEEEAVKPSCEGEGKTAVMGCSRCEYTEGGDTIEATGHKYEAVVTDPTCTDKGYTTHTCSACGDNYKDTEVAALGHNYNEEITVAPGCETTGTKTFTCGTCGHTYTETLGATGHKYEAVVTDPTCTDKGYTTHTCSACGDNYKDTEVEALGHDYKETERVEATYEADGYVKEVCGNCGDEKVTTLPRLTGEAAEVNGVKYGTLQEAIDAAQEGATITLKKDLVLGKDGVIFTKDATLDLAGKNIESVGEVIVVKGGTLTIIGEGELSGNIDEDGSGSAVWANGGAVIIEGGTYKTAKDQTAIDNGDPHSNDTIYVGKEGGSITINGGTFIATEYTWLLNCNNDHEGSIKVYGGTFVGFNPMKDNGIDWTEVNFVVDGKHAELNDEGNYVIADHVGNAPVRENEVPADCENNGSYDEVVYCDCGEELSREEGKVITALGHKMEETAAKVPADCGNDGTEASYTCANGCGKTEGGEVIPATGEHNRNEEFVCSGCGMEMPIADGLYKVNGEYYLYEDGEKVTGKFAKWNDKYGELFIVDGQPSGAGVFEHEGVMKYFTNAHQLGGKDEVAKIYLNAENAKKLVGETATAGEYAILNGVLYSGGFMTWGNYGELFIVNGKPSGTGVFEHEGVMKYFTNAHQFGGKGEAAKIYLNAENAKKLVGETAAAGEYAILNGVLYSGGFMTWGSYGDLFIVNGKPSGAGVFEHEGVMKYFTNAHQLGGKDAVKKYYFNAEKAKELAGEDAIEGEYAILNGELYNGVMDWSAKYTGLYIVDGRPANGTYTIDADVANTLGVTAGEYTFAGGKIK